MDDMTPFSNDDQWLQQYPNTAMTRSRGHEPYDDTTMPVHRDSGQGTIGEVGPKPIRRRSRASRRAPTTVLTASPTDFRALVQRFTGCDTGANMATTTAASASLVNLPKGPVNIDFARNENSSRYTYFDNQGSSSLQGEQMQSVGGFDFPAGYGMENASVDYETIDESSLMETQRKSGSHGYNI